MTPWTTRPTLLEALRSGDDPDAWSEFVQLYGPLVQALARRQGLGADAADALVQDFWVRAVEALPRFRYEPRRGRFRNWVLTVALNEIRQRKRAERARERAMERYRAELGEDARGDEEGAAKWWEHAERQRILEIALERLRAVAPAESYGVFHLAAVQGVPIADVAAFYDLRRERVSLIKFRLLKRLRAIAEQLEREVDGV